MSKAETATQEPEHNGSADFRSYDPFDDRSGGAPPMSDASGTSPEAAPSPAPVVQASSVPDPVLPGLGQSGDQQPNSDGEGGEEAPQRDAASAGILAELKETRTERNSLRNELAELRGLISGMQQARPAQPEVEPEAVQVPDPLHDPAGYHAHVTRSTTAQISAVQAEAQRQIDMTRFRASEAIARVRHTDAVVDKVKDWVKAQGKEAGVYYTQQADPLAAALADYNRAQTIARVGDDPAAYEQQIENRVLERLRSAGIAIPDLPPAAAPIARPTGARPTASAVPPARQAPPAPRVATLANQPRGGAAGPAEVVGSFTDFASDFINK